MAVQKLMFLVDFVSLRKRLKAVMKIGE